MSRPQLPIGTWGSIRREEVTPHRFRARARFRDYDGVTRDVEAWGPSGAAAERALRVKLRDRSTPNNNDINPDMRLNRLGDLWIDELIAEARITPQTIARYEGSLRTAIRPALGNLRIREATVGRLDRFFKTVAAQHPAKARGAKVALSQMLGMAVRHDALATNPVRDIARLGKPRRTVTALTVTDLNTVRDAIRRWQTPTTGKPGPHHNSDLADIVDLLLATGARIGEILALRWDDIDLALPRPTLTFSGTLVYVKARGLFRQPWTKSHASHRTVVLPRFAVDMLLGRQVHATSNTNNAIFHSRTGAWLWPNNVRRQWRAARKDTGLDWVTPHTFRKTVATLLDREASTKAAAEQLGHSSETTTDTYYIQKAKQAPDVSDVLQTLSNPDATA
ncbi:tyrosine-type recombinase/integrase [Dactylosporangium sp. CA-092794]|uniref:tyrosine-type recombinase/integrase n=1 Tax=Dactylosporangium sp. CA-092794 TaxID=3239929 RepID=UPI003D8B41B4